MFAFVILEYLPMYIAIDSGGCTRGRVGTEGVKVYHYQLHVSNSS